MTSKFVAAHKRIILCLTALSVRYLLPCARTFEHLKLRMGYENAQRFWSNFCNGTFCLFLETPNGAKLAGSFHQQHEANVAPEHRYNASTNLACMFLCKLLPCPPHIQQHVGKLFDSSRQVRLVVPNFRHNVLRRSHQHRHLNVRARNRPQSSYH